MEVDDDRIPDELYARIVDRMPTVSVEVVLETDDGVLLARRANEPAAGEWFWPGGRLYRGETFAAAAHRIAEEELGLGIAVQGELGVYNHFWETGRYADVEGTHTVNVAVRATPTDPLGELSLDDQHTAHRFVETIEPDLHPYVRRYLEDLPSFP